ncbi:MAG: ABC transporter permease [Saccharospirillaceae bacterium]|nr:ABC transporter permease [Pseudomonadales bacterium]NRB80336.1 ABC transporter permease [Saccharospirillaceae bacterium]
MFKRFYSVFSSRNKEFFRDRYSFMWSFLFPFLLVFGFAFMFKTQSDLYQVGIISQQDAYINKPHVMGLKHIKFIHYEDNTYAQDLIRRHQLDLLIDIDAHHYWVNRTSPKGYIVERLLLADDSQYNRTSVEGTYIRYIDWVLPGIIAMSIMYSCLFGVGYAIVRYRKNGVLKRFRATPIRAGEFILAHLCSRLLVVMFSSTVIYLGTHFIFDTLMFGKFWHLFVVFFAGAFCMTSFSLLIAARTRSEELTGGLLNILAWPMMGLSGIWFTLEGAPRGLQQVSEYLPLTHIVQAARKVSNEGASLVVVQHHIWVLLLMSAVFLGLAAWLFDWDSDGR